MTLCYMGMSGAPVGRFDDDFSQSTTGPGHLQQEQVYIVVDSYIKLTVERN
jgi:hypothetical protein